MNILKNIIRVSLILAALSFNLVSCDYLDVVPPEQAGLQDATKTRRSTLGFLFTCYAGLQAVDTPIDHTAALCGSTDEYALPIEWRNDSGAYWDDYAFNLISAANTDGLWDTYYKYIGQCYLFLRQVEEHPGETLLHEWLPGEKEQWLAEARFLIAYYHFALLRKYGPIPIVTEYKPQNTSASEFGGRCHFDYCVNWIVSRLDIAAQDLPPTREGTEWGRATSTMAKALKARILMYAASPLWNGKFPYSSWKNKTSTPGDKEFFTGADAKYQESVGRDDYGIELVSSSYNGKKWERAMEACQAALDFATNEGECRLYGTQEADMKLYQTELGNNDKWLPYVPGKEDNDIAENREFKERVMMLRYAVASRYPANKELIWGLTGININGRIQGRIPVHIFQTGNKTAWAGGYSAISPTLYTIEHFYTEDGMLPEEAAAAGDFTPRTEWFKRAGVTGNKREDIVNLYVNREPRFYAWMAFDGGDYGSKLFKTSSGDAGSPCILNMKTSAGHGYDLARSPRNYNVTGFMTQKFVNPTAQFVFDGGAFQAGESKPIPIIRLAELYLNLAECQANVGGVNLADALANLKVVRDRAGVPTPTTVPEQERLIEMIHNERFIEFWNEGHRYHDVRRWAEGKKYFGAKREGLNEMVKDVSFEDFNVPTAINQPYRWDDRLYLAPIQNAEVYRNPQMVQAYGY
ncbi:RagB/SusD family nutrient uptake outer membrane protein [Bacteroides thetaiotaomicron]|uniref:RagB/SusD family nutrient uptake outer membrane protein n=1 Tax=Bacteroides thetaiotaomicron TaxID=818 RepID=UPI001B8AB613|nr:RagB/SusD family nutrient uptake outer membrane protein [Bacteroides thetaiotaomicron]MCA6029316.1 RagB/SusD family nutrient uptake outer membrane protein [Bacteroides thetaiotaomicron]MCE9151398.1 RagB/SusD family nutrient uptake outer membrane protein [Bacteroides thetaiotaomicron]QUT40511.1 SusD family protein [Bacteroides thetaiotaomicron]